MDATSEAAEFTNVEASAVVPMGLAGRLGGRPASHCMEARPRFAAGGCHHSVGGVPLLPAESTLCRGLVGAQTFRPSRSALRELSRMRKAQGSAHCARNVSSGNRLWTRDCRGSNARHITIPCLRWPRA